MGQISALSGGGGRRRVDAVAAPLRNDDAGLVVADQHPVVGAGDDQAGERLEGFGKDAGAGNAGQRLAGGHGIDSVRHRVSVPSRCGRRPMSAWSRVWRNKRRCTAQGSPDEPFYMKRG
jgi:hypothetical protein